MISLEKDFEIYESWQDNWNKFAREALGVRLDYKQREILTAIQNSRRVSVCSGNARGKDYVAAVASLCFLYLNVPSKVIETAPTGRQVTSIMMPEITKIHGDANIRLGGELQTNRIKFEDEPDWFLLGFKAGDKKTEDWSGFHSQNLMVVITEASGIEKETFEAIEGILTGNSKLVIIFNPNRNSGEAYQSTKSPLYKKFKLNSLNAPNVRAKRILIPGQVDYAWIDEKIKKTGWVTKISENELDKTMRDFKWDGEWYRPNNLFLIKVMGEFPRETEDVLIPLAWIESANERWQKLRGKGKGEKKTGVDVAGMGRDSTVFANKVGNVVEGFDVYANPGKAETIHMQIAGIIKNRIKNNETVLIDTIGEGAGVYSRLKEQKLEKAISVKFSFSAKGLTDMTGERTFANMRAYLYWALRDALDPKFGIDLSLPPNDELMQELTEIHWEIKSSGDIIIEDKEKIKKRLGRSPDYADALVNTFYPVKKGKTEKISPDEYGIF